MFVKFDKKAIRINVKKNNLMKYLIVLFLTVFAGKSYGQYDSIAVAILDSMSNEISKLESCSFKFFSEYDIPNDEFGLITHSESGTVYLKGPDKMLIEKKGDKGHKNFYYNGNAFLLYSFDKNQYATVPASMSNIELIDSLSSLYGVEFPGADILYPDFVDNLLETSNNLIYLGLTSVGDKECYHIAGARDDMTFQFWIDADKYSLPVRMSLVYITKPESPRYSIVFTDWKLNENIDDTMFEFSVPSGAQLIKLIK